jgi:hypothetical protein
MRGIARSMTPALAREARRMGALRARTLAGCCGASIGSVPAAVVSASQSVGFDWNTAAPTAQAQAALDAEASPAVQAQLSSDLSTALSAASSGQPISDDQVKAIFTAGATTAAVLAGVSASVAAAVFAPIAAFVFGGGYLVGDAIKALFHITNGTPVACSPEDTSSDYGKSPSDPKWQTYAKNIVAPGVKAYLHAFGGPSSTPLTYLPATTGSFETFARPALEQLYTLELNCKAPPQISTHGQPGGAFKMLLGLAKVWNDAHPGVPMRTVTEQTPKNPTLAQTRAGYDPIQVALADGQQYLNQSRGLAWSLGPLTSVQVANPPPAPPPKKIAFSTAHLILPAKPSSTATSAKASAPAASGLSTGGKLALAGAGAGLATLLWWLQRHRWKWVTPRWARG